MSTQNDFGATIVPMRKRADSAEPQKQVGFTAPVALIDAFTALATKHDRSLAAELRVMMDEAVRRDRQQQDREQNP